MAIFRQWEPTPRLDGSIFTIPTGTTAEAGKKHQRVLALGAALPRARNVVAQDLSAGGLTRERLLATAFRLLDAGHFRIGGEVYAESNGSYGLSTFAPRACPPPALVAGLRVHRQVRRHPYRALTTPAHPKLNWETE